MTLMSMMRQNAVTMHAEGLKWLPCGHAKRVSTVFSYLLPYGCLGCTAFTQGTITQCDVSAILTPKMGCIEIRLFTQSTIWRHGIMSCSKKWLPSAQMHLFYCTSSVRTLIPVFTKYVSLPDMSEVYLTFAMRFYNGSHGIVRRMSDVSLPHFAYTVITVACSNPPGHTFESPKE